MSIEDALQELRLEPRFMRNVARWVELPARAAEYAPFPAGLNARLEPALLARGTTALYTHQAVAVAAALRGEHVAVVTPAASGKTLCYNLPILHRLLADPDARALYLFPTKALAHDQLAELNDLLRLLGARDAAEEIPSTAAGSKRRWDAGTRGMPPHSSISPSPRLPTCATYDGDTPSSHRARIRDTARIVLSNPDMLHTGILPQHARWASFFANLRVVVIDEMHIYRGVFGSHVANVLRRLRRLCRFHGSDPQFLLASATIANPADLAFQLVEAPVTVIGPEENGAPQGKKVLLFYNPPMVDPALGIRRSSSLEAADLATHFLRHHVQTIVFARARLTTELILTYLQSENHRISESANRHPLSAIRGYRGGYLPAQRREIERGLRTGTVQCVVTTNALELGIDIGQLDVALLAGYPGTIAATRQQMGRAGRRQATSAAVLVAAADALDQYIVAHPDYLLAGSSERALINPDNEVILAGHLACAAAELPLRESEILGTAPRTGAGSGLAGSGSPGMADLLDDLVEAGQLYRAGEHLYWAGEGYPAASLSLRSTSADRVVIQTTEADRQPQVIGELDRFSVPLLAYEGAIYLHEGASYLVERLDWDAGIASVRPVQVDFYTRSSIAESTEILAERDSTQVKLETRSLKLDAGSQSPAPSFQYPVSSYHAAWGDIRVVSQANGYKVLRRGTNETLGFGTIDLPEQILETQGCWLALSSDLIEQLRATGDWISDPNEYGPEWPALREAIRSRDGYRCQACGAPEPAGQSQIPSRFLGSGQHDVHHKIPFRAFIADPSLRPGLTPSEAWRAANHPENLVTLCPACHRRAEANVRTRSGLGGLAALLSGIAPLHLMCDPRDLGAVTEPKAPHTGLPTITIYEKIPFGVGYAQEIWRSMPDLLRAALERVTECPCDHGCPACVGPILEHEYALDTKALATALLRRLCA